MTGARDVKAINVEGLHIPETDAIPVTMKKCHLPERVRDQIAAMPTFHILFWIRPAYRLDLVTPVSCRGTLQREFPSDRQQTPT